MSNIATFRRKISDRVKAGKDIIEGNGVDRIVSLQNKNVWDVVIAANGDEVDPVDYSVDAEPGRISFNTAPANGVAVSINYLYATYSDTEIEALVAETGDVDGAVIAALEELTMDTARFYDFTQGETSEKRSQVFKNLLALLDNYRTKKKEDDEVARRGSGLKVGRRTTGPEDRRRRRPTYFAPSRREP